jgi:hypothetical protein
MALAAAAEVEEVLVELTLLQVVLVEQMVALVVTVAQQTITQFHLELLVLAVLITVRAAEVLVEVLAVTVQTVVALVAQAK